MIEADLYVKKVKESTTSSVEKGVETWYSLELSSGDGAFRGTLRSMEPFDGHFPKQAVNLTLEPVEATPTEDKEESEAV